MYSNSGDNLFGNYFVTYGVSNLTKPERGGCPVDNLFDLYDIKNVTLNNVRPLCYDDNIINERL